MTLAAVDREINSAFEAFQLNHAQLQTTSRTANVWKGGQAAHRPGEHTEGLGEEGGKGQF